MKRLLFILTVAVAVVLGFGSCETCPSDYPAKKVLYGNIVDVQARKVFPGELTIDEGRVVSVKETSGVYDTYILPGFVDSHIHIESTLMVPENYARMAVANGVVAAVCDPHEIANVLGVPGIDFMIENGNNARFYFNFMAPSCVPSTTFETSGATLDAEQVAGLLARDEIMGLAEMMNVPGVVYDDAQVLAKLQAAINVGKPIDGHAPKTSGEQLQKYVAAGVSTDHECTSVDEAKEKLALGMKIIIREGSAACDFEALHTLIKEHPGQVLFCSDDMYPDDVETIGYINGLVRRAVAKGMPLWETLDAACVTPVKHYMLKNGLLGEGDSADFIVVNNLNEFKILSTYIQGYEVYNATKGVTDALRRATTTVDLATLNYFQAEELDVADIAVKCEGEHLKVITASEGSLITGKEVVKPKSDAAGNVVTDVDSGIAKLVVYNRYAAAAPQVAYIKGFGLRRGALASTIAHDSHNIIALGCDDKDIVTVINRLIAEKGGITVCDGEQIKCLPLPIAGLMTTLKAEEVAQNHLTLKQMAKDMGCTINAPFMTMAFMALPVIPDLKLTDMGLFDGIAFGFTSLWE